MTSQSAAAQAAARRALQEFAPDDDEQRALRDDYLHLLATRPDALQRECWPDHLTASAIVLSSDARGVLLHLHGKVNRWLQFGGHIEAGDVDLAAAALRETVEESGISDLTLWSDAPLRLDRHVAPCAPGNAVHHLDVQFLAVTTARQQPQVSAESQDVQWFDVATLPPDTDASVRALVRDAVSALVSATSPSGPAAGPPSATRQ